MSDLPVTSLADAVPHLRRPFTPEAIKWKVQATGPKDKPKTWGMVVPYIDARLVIERLDAVIPGLWGDRTEPVVSNGNAMVCHLTLDECTRSDVGESGHSLKAAASDALKRAGVRFGIGASIYAMNRVMLDVTLAGEMKGDRPTLKQKSVQGKHTAELTPQAEKWLREKYGAWLKTVKDHFGEALDHGDTSETLGLEGAEQRPPEQEDPEHEAAVLEVQHLYDSLTATQKKGLSRDKFKQQLRDASEDPAQLKKLRTQIEGRSDA